MVFVATSQPQRPLPPSPPAAAAAAAPAADRGAMTEENEVVLEEVVQPLEVFDLAELQDSIGSDRVGVDAGVVGGIPEGVPGGILGGLRDGVIGGDPDGDPLKKDLGGGGPLHITPDISAPVLTHRVEPVFPEGARRARQQGKVILQAVVSAAGTVQEVTVLRSSPLFDQAAIEAVRQWRYEPARHGARPVAVYFTVQVEFVLQP
jgi:protein TonB